MVRHLLPLLLVAACGSEPAPRLGPPRDAGVDGGSGYDASTDAGRDGGKDAGLASPECDERARWIYVFDDSNRLLRFEPDSLTFHPVSTAALTCPAASGATPFSMAVDRFAIAWVLYSDGSLHRASTVDGACATTSYVGQQLGMSLFGMGFALDRLNDPNETLYVAGPGTDGGVFASLDVVSLAITARGSIAGSPELTGNALTELWGFYPAQSPPRIARLATDDGEELETFDLATVGPDTLTPGSTRAWAFAFWGGDYWAFYRSMDEAHTNVYRFAPPRSGAPASFTRVVADTGLTIVGAGVSTCTPVIME